MHPQIAGNIRDSADLFLEPGARLSHETLLGTSILFVMNHGLLSPGSHIPGYGASVKPGAYHLRQNLQFCWDESGRFMSPPRSRLPLRLYL